MYEFTECGKRLYTGVHATVILLGIGMEFFGFLSGNFWVCLFFCIPGMLFVGLGIYRILEQMFLD